MRRGVHIIALLALLILTSGLSSCVHKDLCFHHPHETKIRVVFDWRDAPEADPAGMCIWFYPVEGGSPVRMNFKGRDGGEVTLTAGEYRILSYNNDTEAVLFANTDNMDKHSVFTREGDVLEPAYGNGYHSSKVPKPLDAADERVVITPDMLWGCTAADISVTDSDQMITLYPHELLCSYTYEVRNVKHLKHLTRICGSLSGMSGLMTLADEQLGKECVTLPFSGNSDGVSKITGQFYTFGHHEENTKAHRMVFYVWMDDGKKYVYGSEAEEKFNVTDQIHGAQDKRRVHIVIDGLDLPKPIENGEGYSPSVDAWGEVYKDVIM